MAAKEESKERRSPERRLVWTAVASFAKATASQGKPPLIGGPELFINRRGGSRQKPCSLPIVKNSAATCRAVFVRYYRFVRQASPVTNYRRRRILWMTTTRRVSGRTVEPDPKTNTQGESPPRSWQGFNYKHFAADRADLPATSKS